jgi:hypothetical protein
VVREAANDDAGETVMVEDEERTCAAESGGEAWYASRGRWGIGISVDPKVRNAKSETVLGMITECRRSRVFFVGGI